MDFIMSETNYSPYYHYGWVVSDDLLKIYDEKDLRRSIYHTPTRMPGVEGTTDGTFRCIKLKDKNKDGYVSDMFLLRYPEVILNKAEALAMLGREDDSKACLQELRSNRFKGADLQSVVETGDDYITFVIYDVMLYLLYILSRKRSFTRIMTVGLVLVPVSGMREMNTNLPGITG